MTPTLVGRLQTRLVLLSSVGVLWTLAVTPLLPRPAGATVQQAYRVTLETAIAMMVLGVLWEFAYHGLQQLRWDKDWPSMLGLVTVASEAVPVWLVLHALRIVPGGWGLESPVLPLFATHVLSTWVLVWLVVQGPVRVILPRWRVEGGTFSRRPPDFVVPFVVMNIGMVFSLAGLWLSWR